MKTFIKHRIMKLPASSNIFNIFDIFNIEQLYNVANILIKFLFLTKNSPFVCTRKERYFLVNLILISSRERRERDIFSCFAREQKFLDVSSFIRPRNAARSNRIREIFETPSVSLLSGQLAWLRSRMKRADTKPVATRSIS